MRENRGDYVWTYWLVLFKEDSPSKKVVIVEEVLKVIDIDDTGFT